MKILNLRHRDIIQAIRNACIALFLLAASQRGAAAQSLTPPFQVSGNVVTTTSGPYGNGTGMNEPNANYTSITIGPNTTINTDTTYAGSFPSLQSVIQTSTSTFTNQGTIALAEPTGVTPGAQVAVIDLDQGATSLNFTNSGALSGSIQAAGSTFLQAALLNSTTGDISFTNTGSVYIGQADSGTAVSINSNSGNITINNEVGGSITQGTYYRVVQATTGGAGTINFNNAGTISNVGNITVDLSAGLGDIQGANSGTISGGEYGIYASTQGNASFTNSATGTISGSSSGVYLEATGTGFASNDGTINGGLTVMGNAGATAINTNLITNANAGISVSGLGALSATNTGSITNSGYGIVAFQSSSGPSSILVDNSGTITTTGSGIYAGSTDAIPITINNSGTIDSGGTGIMLLNAGTVINSGPLSGTVAAINVPTGSSVILRGNTATPNAVVNGAIIGGMNTGSASTLEFNERVPNANYTADRAELDAEIAAYATQGGGTQLFTFEGLTFNVTDFDYNGGVIDALLGRLYVTTPGFSSLGAALDRLNTLNPPPTMLVALNALPDNAVAPALAELSPQPLQIFRNVAFDNNTFTASQINNHLANVRGGQTGFDSSQLTIKDSSLDPTLQQVRSHLVAYDPSSAPGLRTDGALSDVIDPIIGSAIVRDAKDAKDAQVSSAPAQQRWSSFIAGDVILADLSSQTPLMQNSDYTTGSVTAGLDYRLTEHFTLGALVAYAHTAADLDERGSSATVDSYSPGLYASYVQGPWYANGMASYTRNAYTEDRMIDIPGIAGDNHGATSGNQAAVNLTGGREFFSGPFEFGPTISAQYVHLAIDSINEQGPTALEINRQNQDSLRSLLGFEGRYAARVATPVGMVELTPHISASWQHEYLDNSEGITSQFNGIGGGSFTVQTNSPERDSAFLDLGLDAGINQNVVLFIDYAAQAGQDDFFAQSADGGVKIGF
jgi:uncharacterized protein YhjY with autotransporter beta-barrel domain